MPLKILQVMAGAEAGGAETAFVDTCLALQAAGLHIEVATRPNARNARLHAAGIIVHELRFGGRLDFMTARHLKKIIRTFQPVIVQTWMSRAAQKMPRRPDDASYKVVSRLGGYYSLRNFRRSDFFITITPDIANYLTRQGVPADRIRVINNFADVEPAAMPVNRAALTTPNNAPLILALGRLHRAKAFDVLLTAMVELPGAYLWLAGDGPERAALEQQAIALKVTDRVRFLGWRDDRAALFAAADICVFPSRYEPFGTVFVQAWAHQKPLITAAADGPRQYVRDGEDGLVVPINDAPALAAALRRVIEQPDLAAQLAAKGQQRYEQGFTKERSMANYLDWYRQIAASETASGAAARSAT